MRRPRAVGRPHGPAVAAEAHLRPADRHQRLDRDDEALGQRFGQVGVEDVGDLGVLDRRLHGLAARFGAAYTRYADDIALSGGSLLLARATDVRVAIAAIAREEGFSVNVRKSALMTRAGRQRVCGIVVNAHPNVARSEYDRLKAILHNCAVRGPAEHNRGGVADLRAHLTGRVTWVESVNPVRGAKLRARLEQIDWSPVSNDRSTPGS